MKGFMDCLFYRLIERLSVCNPDLHLGRVDIHIDPSRIDPKMQHTERKLMLHQIFPISLLDGSADQVTLNISAVNIENLIIPVSPVNHRLSQKTADIYPLPLPCKGNQLGGNIPTIDTVNDLLQFPVSRGIESGLSIHDIFKGNLGIGKGKMLHQIGHIRPFRLRLF